MKHLSHSPDETKQIAADFAKTLHGGEVIALEGELGAGKTTFVQGLAEVLGAEGPIRSPTFTIMNMYRVPQGPIREIIHLDYYRLKHPEEVQNLGLEEWLGRGDTVVLIEWPDRLSGVSWRSIRTVHLGYGKGQSREISFS